WQLSEDPRRGEELKAREDDRRGREAGLQMDGIAEEETEVALRARVVRREQSRGKRDDGEGRKRCSEPTVRTHARREVRSVPRHAPPAARAQDATSRAARAGP